MGVSFKVSKVGKRFRAKPAVVQEPELDEDSENHDSSLIGSKNESSVKKLEGDITEGNEDVSAILSISENEVSFTLNLYPDGYSIGKPSENEAARQNMLQDSSKLLHPYDKTSETLFSAIESGRLPGDILNDIPCKFVNGTLSCEVRDYRKCVSERGIIPSVPPAVNRVRLRMSLENVVKDIPLISDHTWTYGDLMEVESRILKALQPKLCLDPTPKLDRLSNDPAPVKLNLGLSSLRRKRLRQMPEVTVTSSNRIHGKKVCIDRVPEGSNGTMTVQDNQIMQNISQSNAFPMGGRTFVPDGNISALSQPQRYQMGVSNPRQDQGSGPLVTISAASPSGQDILAYGDNSGSQLHGKRENQDGQMSPLAGFNKRARVGPDGAQQMDGLHGSDMSWKNSLLQHQNLARGIHYTNPGIQKFPQQMFDGTMNQSTVRFAPKEEQFDTDSNMHLVGPESGHLDPQQARIQQRLPPHLMRSNYPQGAWNNLGHDPRKEEQLQKRKSAQSPRLSAGAFPQSPLSSKSGEFSSGSAGAHFGAAGAQKSVVSSVPVLTSGAKRRANSVPKSQAMSGVGSPVSVGNISVPLNASSPSVGTPPVADQSMIERFSKIEYVTMRHQLNNKKNKADEYVRKPKAYSPQPLMACFSNLSNNEDVKDDEKPLSKSIISGSMNICKMRIINMQADRGSQGNAFVRMRTRMIMSEKSSDGTVALLYGEAEDGDFLSVEDYLPTLPNTNYADLLASQFCSLMIREGYVMELDSIQQKPTPSNIASGLPPNNPAVEQQQYSEGISGHTSNDIKPNITGNTPINPSQNITNARMLPPGTPQLPISQGLLSSVSMPARSQPLDVQSPLQQQQQNQQSLMQQHQQLQRSQMVLPSNPLLNSVQLGNQLVNKPTHLQLQLLQQQQQQLQPQQQQSQPQMQQQRKMMMGIGAMGMRGMGNNMVGLGTLTNTMGIGSRGLGPGLSDPTGSISVGQNSMNLGQASNLLSQHIRTGQITQEQAAFLQSKLRMAQNRNLIGNPQAGLTGLPGARQMQPGSAGMSMLGQNLNRVNMNPNPMQRAGMAPMGPPKLMAGMNLYMNQQQQQQPTQQMQMQQQQQQFQPQQQQLQQLQQQQMQQQQQTQDPSTLQAVVSLQQVGSPSTMGIQQMNQQQPLQHPSPQQMNQRTPMSPQLSSGAIHAMSAGNPEACPASPQLSSQTLGSVGSITNSPMELQGVNKSNSVTNA